MPKRLSFQLYCARKFPPLADTLRLLSSIGYKEVEGYGGVYDDVVPHLTVGDRPAGGVSELRAAEADVLRWLPIEARISRVWLMTGNAAPGSWQTVAELALATG